MNGSYLTKSVVACTAGAAFSLSGFLAAGEPGQMTREVWNNIPGSQLSAFTGGVRYWQTADAVTTFAGATAPSNAGDGFAARIRAHVTAPGTGNYTFWIASDDDSELYLSPDDSKFDRTKIASLSGWVNPGEWDVKASQKSAPIPLMAGQRYFVESLHKDAGGVDHLAIAWSCNAPLLPSGYLPVGTAPAAIVATGISLAGVTNAGGLMSGAWINILPVANTFHFSNDGNSASFQLQFYDGTYTKVAKIVLAQSGADIVASQVYAKYKAGNQLGQNFDTIASSSNAPLGSSGYGVSAVTLAGQDGVLASTRQVIPASALESFTADPNDLDNDELRDDWENANGFSLSDYGVANPAQHPLADPDHDGYSNLEESQLGTNPGVRGGVPGSLLLETWNNLSGSKVEDLTYQAPYFGAPDKSEFVFSAQTPVNRADNFGARMRGYVVAPATGNYTFYIAGDDSCQLWLSSSDSQFAKEKVASLDGYTADGQWNRYASQKSAVVSLQAGQKIYIEALQKEGGTADHLEIGWTTPGSSGISVIPGSALESYAYDANDVDGDNMPDDWEALHGLNPTINDAALDPDQDGIPNQLEATSNTDPQTKNTIAGALLQELWLNVPGYRVAELTSSPRFLQQPDFRSLAPSAQTFSQPYNSFGSRLRGYLTAPTTGSYTFWVLGDDETELWLSSSDSKFDRQLLARPTLNTSGFDTDLSQKSRPVSLVAGQTYYLEVLHKDYYDGDFCQIAWTKPGAAREVIPGSALRTFIPIANDQDDDDLPDDWETSRGLSPHDNGSINPSNGSQGDLDGDGLTNAGEFEAGTRADLADTDGDGVNDRDEVEMMETSALTADAAPFEIIATLPGSSFTASSGSWLQESGKAKQCCVRGWLEYPVSLPVAGVYQLDLAFTPVTDVDVSRDYEIVFSADGKNIQRETVTLAEAASGHAKVLSPWLAAGSHTLRVFIDNSHWFRRVSIDRLEILAARGPDINGNGRPDWIDLRLVKNNSVEAPSESLTSPVCIEGRAKWSDLTFIAGTAAQPATEDRWYADVPLDATQPSEITTSFENGCLTATRQVSWISTNLLSTTNLTIRLGDSLKLSAFTGNTGTSEETVAITVEGQTTTITSDQPLVHTFTTAGVVPIYVSHSLDGSLTTATVTITVVAPPVIESPACVIGYYREVRIPSLPNGPYLQFDERLDIREILPNSDGSTTYTLRMNDLADIAMMYRLGGVTGPILGRMRLTPMRVRSGSDTAVIYGAGPVSNTWNVKIPIIVDGARPDVELKYEIYIAGVTFDDGTLNKTLTYNDLNSEGEATLNLYKTGTAGSSCYRCKIVQNGGMIAFYQ